MKMANEDRSLPESRDDLSLESRDSLPSRRVPWNYRTKLNATGPRQRVPKATSYYEHVGPISNS
jgi:hypothetical protein